MSENNDSLKQCLICGDKAIGNNFNALSCESCKSFFRRNALKFKQLKCHYNQKCTINTFNRKFCKKCRLEKCFTVGMNKKKIISSHEKMIKKFEKLKNDKQIDNSNNVELHDNQLEISSDQVDAIDNLSINIDHQYVDYYGALDQFVNNQNSDQIFDNISDLVFHDTVELEFTVSPIERPVADHRYTFNELEGYKMTELFGSSHPFTEPKSRQIRRAMNYADLYMAMTYKIDQQMLRLINMSKSLSTFNTICENDKICLIKYGALELFCLRAVPFYDCLLNQWTYTLVSCRRRDVSYYKFRVNSKFSIQSLRML
ncbi:vitamin D3 receptor A-like [Oppia nitens]|uniref:vitamin D3 receptor A-like n=1 Tax=Oppia nitens TaxID=1686743 RepID=UPI0023DA0328|nr:vitamin D3 receptor A-like [Oppia nitens]